jgi:hypothetical protein
MLVVSSLQGSMPVLICFSLVLVFMQLLDWFNDRAIRPIPAALGTWGLWDSSARGTAPLIHMFWCIFSTVILRIVVRSLFVQCIQRLEIQHRSCQMSNSQGFSLIFGIRSPQARCASRGRRSS